ncbi:MAG: D-alanyl-D-alanine carboxypeptidase, partial [Actinomycetota bacterium]
MLLSLLVSISATIWLIGTDSRLAKTGTLTGVKSLSGMFPLSDGRSSVFSLIMNGPGSSTLNFYRPI